MRTFKGKIILFFLWVAAGFFDAAAQFHDDFSDGNFTENPVWVGDSSLFIINADFQLQLNDTTGRTAALTTENHRIKNTEWQFWIQLDFAPSSASFARVYLCSDSADLHQPLNGYFLQFGESGGTDAIELFRQNGTENISICRSADSIISKKFTARIKVLCDNTGKWTLFADMTGENSFVLLASGTDEPNFNSAYFGVFTKYAPSYAQKIFFDDFYVGDEIIDTEPPIIESLTAISPSSIQIVFNESVTSESAQNINHYEVAAENLHPHSAVLSENGKEVLLSFNSEWIVNHTYTLNVREIADFSGNIAPLLTGEFAWIVEQPFDVLFNEIMADPTPVVGLPEFEYIELYNRTENAINLSNWMLSIGNSTSTFADVSIDPHSYLILCDEDAVELFSTYGNTYGFSSLSLTNSGQTLTLLNEQGSTISQVTYSDSWYGDALKKNGGWSLELIDPENFCGTANNWTVSVNIHGGTPGSINSVHGENPDEENPLLLRAEYFNDNRINVYFNETMDAQSVSDNNNWSVDNGLIIAGIFPVAPDYTTAQIIFTSSIEVGETYTLSVITDQITDCVGHSVDINSFVLFAKPETIEKNDIVINEVLHNARYDGVQYVELYNRSSKTLDTKQLRFIFEKTSGIDTTHVALPSFLLFPQAYCVLTKSPEIVQQQYHVPYPETLISVAGFPSMIVAEGIIRISKAEDAAQEIDAMQYSEKMHAALLNTDKGVSLERIHPDRPSGDATNWHSAAELAGFGTPGYQNSQYDDGTGEDEISIDPELFTPNNDGIDDYLNIRYQFDETDYTMNVFIFDARGNRIRHLINNESTGTEGTFSWDGKDESGQLSNAGIYIIYIERFDLQGNVKRWKKTGTLGVKF